MANINWGVIDPNTPAMVANSFYQGQQEAAKNALAAQQLQQAQAANELAKYQLSSARRSDEVQNAFLRDLNAAGSDPSAIQAAYIRAGKGKEAFDMQKAQQDIAKSKADTAALLIKNHRDILPAVNDQATFDAWRTNAIRDLPGLASIIPTTFSPEAKQGLMLKADQALEKHFATQDLGGTTRTLAMPKYGQGPAMVVPGTEARVSLTPGQAASLAQAERHFQATQAQPNLQHVETAEGVMTFNPRTGQMAPILGPSGQPVTGGKGLTEVQGKATLFASRAEEANKIMNELGGKYSPAAISAKQSLEKTPLIGGVAGAGVNIAMSPETQKAEQAQRDFINAILRQESGAAIAQSEFDNARRQYFPQPGDSKAVMEQKAKNRQTAIKGLQVMAGPGLKMMPKERPSLESFGSK